MAPLLCLDPIGGIAGDMFLALCLDLGVPLEALRQGLSALPVDGYRLEVTRQQRAGITGTHLEVRLDIPRDPGAHRPWGELKRMLEGSRLAPPVRERALAVFSGLARAEAHVHGTDEESVEFHEVGAVDSIVDVVGAALALELLGNPELIAGPPPMGSGLTRSAHGPLPLPPPATLELLKGRLVRFEGVGERTTPTGAALLAALAQSAPFPPMVLERVGYGLGTRDFPDRPNVLRGLWGRRAEQTADDGLWVLEANLDDATPQLIAWAMERALAEGALDAWVSPLTMKKGRPGHLLGLLCRGRDQGRLGELLLRETPSLGVRRHRVERLEAERSFETVETPYGPIRVKLAHLEGRPLNAQPEYEDCARLAREKAVPLKDVLAAALAALAPRQGAR